MSWIARLFGRRQASAKGSLPRARGKRVALAVVVNLGGAIVIDAAGRGGGSSGGISTEMVRSFIDQDIDGNPHLRSKAAAIEEIVIMTDEKISSSAFDQDMAKCYLKHMRANGWACVGRLHVFETFIASVTVYVAYGI